MQATASKLTKIVKKEEAMHVCVCEREEEEEQG